MFQERDCQNSFGMQMICFPFIIREEQDREIWFDSFHKSVTFILCQDACHVLKGKEPIADIMHTVETCLPEQKQHMQFQSS